MEKTDVEKIKQQLLNRIDTTDLLEVRKIERYCKLLQLDEDCSKAIEKDGASIVVENGSQRFIKSHPSMNDKIKINAQLIALEKSINFRSASPSSTTVEGKSESGGLI